MTFEIKSTIAAAGGRILKLSHPSSATKTPMAVNIFLPPSASATAPAPVLLYLSGLTCSPDNCTEKGFLHIWAARAGIALVWPDTSPRGLALPGEHDAWDFGSAAGFYIDATQAPWRDHYRMEEYVVRELPAALAAQFAELDMKRVSIAGHSMGGHGALTLYLKNPGMYKSVSAWAPIANAAQCGWGEKAFSGYLGEDREEWKKHDATELVAGWKGPLNALIDVGTDDPFYKQKQLLPENFEAAAEKAGLQGLTVRYQKGYDHSYFFVSTFGEDHVKHAAKFLFS
ncbi:hypothetical protein TD95_004115 [Thielaviopsis punctulata]|uniref:S-formylglutathione hydrolase n=1 Tax=Thielaviopsis punctulata TaxID=72032 RepID=A0A0F4ZK81_9PEZI|nr:hypothetical protein TD95_004115 [Thielaviopsis punctulata]